MAKTIYYTKNAWHLGDNIFCCIFFSKIKKYIEDNNIFIQHYCEFDNVEQTKDFINTNNISIFDITELPQDKPVIDLWIGSTEYEYNYYNNFANYDEFLKNFYNNILVSLKFPIVIHDFVFDDEEGDFLLREKEINNRTNDYYKNIDILIINGKPKSNQLEYDQTVWDTIIKKFATHMNVVTSQKVDGIKCTRDYNLTAKDIACISINVKTIIAIDSGPATGLYNKYVINNAKVVYYLCSQDKCHTSFPNFVKKKNITDIEDLLEHNIIEGFISNYIDFLYLVLFILLGLIIIVIFINYKKTRKFLLYLHR